MIGPIHADFNAFLEENGEAPYPIGQFFEASPFMNLLLYPEPVKFKRRHALDPKRFQYLEGCVRTEKPYEVPRFAKNNDGPLIYVSFGSLGAGDTELLKRIIAAIGKTRYRALVNVGGYQAQYSDVPPNVIIDSWFPQPSVIPQVDAVIHHGGNNSFTECLYFGKPAIIMPYVWDGHDNATRVQETGHGFKMPRYDWTEDQLDRKDRSLPHRPGHEEEARRDLGAHAQGERPGQGGEGADAILSSTGATMAEAQLDLRLTMELGPLDLPKPRRLGRRPDDDRGRVAHLRKGAAQGTGGPIGMRALGLHAGQMGLPRHPRRVLPLPRRALHLRA